MTLCFSIVSLLTKNIPTVTIFGPDPLNDLFGLPATKFQENLNALYHTSPTIYTHQDLQRHVWDALEWILVGELYSFDLRFCQRGTMQESVVASMSLLHAVPMTVLDHLRQSLPDRGPKDSILNLKHLSLLQVTDSIAITNNKLARSILDPVDSTAREPHTHANNNIMPSHNSEDVDRDSISDFGDHEAASLLDQLRLLDPLSLEDGDQSRYGRVLPLEPTSCHPAARRRSRLSASDPSTDDSLINTQLSELSLRNRPIPQLSQAEVAGDQVQPEFEYDLDDKDEDEFGEEFGDDEELIKILVEMADGERARSTC